MENPPSKRNLGRYSQKQSNKVTMYLVNLPVKPQLTLKDKTQDTFEGYVNNIEAEMTIQAIITSKIN
ncbi:hypothetical protein E2P61_03795 [Candidatus Bathyarchaeota archaeon]|nr:hypothetical protein E2P61_03795 [Candidatus Bathyarchaeota archaeon]